MAIKKIDNFNIHENPSTNENAFDIENYLNANFIKAKEVINNNADELETLETDNTTNKTNIEQLQNENIQLKSKNEQLELECKRLKEDNKSIAIVEEASGEVLSLSDSSSARFNEFEISGNCEQESREGYNFINVIAESQTVNGISFTVNKDGTVLANGTSTEAINFIIAKDIVLKPSTYTLSDGTGKSSNSTYFIFCDGPSLSTGGLSSLEITEETIITTVRIVIRKGQTLNNVLFKPMIYKGTAEKEYEQYGAMPSFDYPSEIKTVGQELIKGYNLVDFGNPTSKPSQIQVTFENDVLTLAGDGSYDYQCITYDILDIFKNNKGKTITVQVENATSSNSSALRTIQIYYVDTTSHYFDILNSSNVRNTVSIPNTDVTNALLRVFTNNGTKKQNTATFTKPMLYIGTANDTKKYEQHQEKKQYGASFTVCKKGLLDVTDFKVTGGTTQYEGKSIEINLVKGTYTFLRKFRKSENAPANAGMVQFYVNNVEISEKLTPQEEKIQFTIENDCKFTIRFRLSTSIVSSFESWVEFYAIQLEEGTEHEEQTYTIPIQKEFCKIGDYKDRFVKKDDKWFEEHVIEKIKLEASKNWAKSNNGYWYYYAHTTDKVAVNSKILCNYFSTSNWNQNKINTICYGNGPQGVIGISAQNFETVEELKEFLNNNEVYTYIEKEPEYIECIEEQSQILDEIETELHSYEGGTHVFSTDEISPNFNVKYSADLKAYINNLSKEVINNV